MKDILKNLLKIKSIMTICIMVVFSVLALNGSIEPAVTASVISSVITYYFTKENNSKISVEGSSSSLKTVDNKLIEQETNEAKPV